MKDFTYVLPKDAAEAARAAAAPNCALKGAGTDLVDRMKEGVTRPHTVVNLLTATDLRSPIREENGRIVMGGATTLAEVAESALIRKVAPGFADAAAEAATPQIRNRGTVAGNLCQRPRCWYFRNDTYACSKKGGETCYSIEGENKYHAIFENVTCNIVHPSNLAPILQVLGGTLHVVTAKGTDVVASDVAVKDFWVRPEEDISRENILVAGQVVREVSFPIPQGMTGSSYVETREKASFDWALTSCAAALTLDGGKIASASVVLSSVAPTPLQLEAVEKWLVGKAPSDALFREAGTKATDGATPMRDNAYKITLTAVVVRRALSAAAARATGGGK